MKLEERFSVANNRFDFSERQEGEKGKSLKVDLSEIKGFVNGYSRRSAT